MLQRKIKQRRRVGKERAMWIVERKCISGRENSKCKGPEVAQVCLELEEQQRDQQAWNRVGKGRQEGGESNEVVRVEMLRSYRHSKGLGFSSEQDRSHQTCEQAEERCPLVEHLPDRSRIHCSDYRKKYLIRDRQWKWKWQEVIRIQNIFGR